LEKAQNSGLPDPGISSLAAAPDGPNTGLGLRLVVFLHDLGFEDQVGKASRNYEFS
jgi:hypothetical protein